MRIGGMIAYIGAEEFWRNLSEPERDAIRRWEEKIGGKAKLIDQGEIKWCNQTKDSFFGAWAEWAISEKMYDFAEKMLLYAEENKSTALRYHFVCNSFIKLYYKQRDSRSDAIEKTKEYCLKDIKQYSKYARQLHKDGKASVPSFKQLCIIYEKEKNYTAAIEICKKAIKYELHDGTKADFLGRLEKLLSKETK